MSSFRCGGARIRAPESGDAVGGGPACGVGAAAEDGGDFGVGQPGQVVIGDGLLLLGGQPGQGLREIVVEIQAGLAGPAIMSGGWATGMACRAAARVRSMALRCAIVISQASTFAVAGSSG